MNPQSTPAPRSVAALVAAARDDDAKAFDELVRRFYGMALASAHARLGDLELARDATQEAFALAHGLLGQLREDAAFGGWLRRIVGTQADRIARGRTPTPSAGVEERASELPGRWAPEEPTPLAALERRGLQERVREALERLPEAQRLVVSLFYLAEESVAEIAAFLEISEGAVKKRLHDARKRMQARGTSLTLPAPAAPAEPVEASLEREVSLFIALREDDLISVAALLRRDPELVLAAERWPADEALRRGWPIATGATPLIRAAERDHPEMIDLLLTHGAPIDGACGCAGGESPLWAAVVTGRRRAAEHLLALGAAADRPAFRGQTPLHVAAGRGDLEIVDRLLRAGASPEALDDEGRSPADWARLKGHREALARFSGLGAGAPAPPESPSAAEPVEAGPLWDSGIKAVDLLAPIRQGALVRVHGGAGVGRNVLLAELSHRWRRSRSAPVLWALRQREAWEPADFDQLRAETGLDEEVEILAAPAAGTTGDEAPLSERVLERVRECRRAGTSPLLVWFEQEGARSEFEALSPRLKRRATTLVVPPVSSDASAEVPPLAAPFDSAIVLDPALARIAHYPALDPVRSGRRGDASDPEDARRGEIAARARALLAEWRRCAPDAHPERLTEPRWQGRADLARALRLQHYLTQPFHTTEPFGGRPGVDVHPEEWCRDIEEILEGARDDDPPESFFFRGALSERGAG